MANLEAGSRLYAGGGGQKLHHERDEQQRAHGLELRHQRPSPMFQQKPGGRHARNSQNAQAEHQYPELQRDFAPDAKECH